ncbi:MAG: zinc ribbon domain-containing protein [Pirellulales bacterium]
MKRPKPRNEPTSAARVLVQCSACRRQYDATSVKPGSQFRCQCGELVTVKAPRGHDASVVRCANCGAPRESLAISCGFCRSEFTLHERDLETVCPACQARVSNRAKFCHHCGTGLAAELVAGQQSKFLCPVCDSQPALVSRLLKLESTAVLECPVCLGMWLSVQVLHQILEGEPRAGSKAPGHLIPTPPPTAGGYRPCVECGGLMTRRNFGFSASGVIVDICGKHGIWFDADEFMHLMAWVRTDGLESARDDLARLSASPDQLRRRAVQRRISTNPTPHSPRDSAEPLADDDSPLTRAFGLLTHLASAGDVLAAMISALLGK